MLVKRQQAANSFPRCWRRGGDRVPREIKKAVLHFVLNLTLHFILNLTLHFILNLTTFKEKIMVNINQLQSLVSKYKNTHYKKISDAEYEAADWSGIWPLVNGAGLLTGELYDGQSGVYVMLSNSI